MKILFVHHRYHTNLFYWFRGLQQNGHEVRLLVYKRDEVDQPDLPKSTFLAPSSWSARKMKKNIRTRGDGVDGFSPYYYPSFKVLYRYFKSESPNVVVIRPAFSRFAYMTLFCALLFGVKRVFYSQIRIHKAYSKHKLLIFNLMMWLLKAHWISPCLGDKTKYPKAPERMVYFPFAIPLLSQNRDGNQTNTVKFLSVAKYFKSKNPKLLLEVFLDLCDTYPNIYLTVCGSGDEQGGYYQEMKRTVAQSRHQGRVKLLINRPYEDVQNLYRTQQVFILPSKHDPAAITNLEAMAHGLPVICSENNGTAQYTVSGQTGYIFSISNKQDLYDMMESLITNQVLIKKMAENTVKQVKSCHDPKLITSTFLNSIL